MPEARKRTAVLISGRGSNLAALVEAARNPSYPAEIALVVSSRPDAAGLRHATGDIRSLVLDAHSFSTRSEFEMHLDAALREAEVEIVCLAGFMRLLSRRFVESWRDKVLNIHPSLLPAFPGLRSHEQALLTGVRIHGATVHFVRPATDAGPIVAQAAVSVLPSDTAQTLAARVLEVEHRLYPHALALVASGRARVAGERVVIDGEATAAGAPLLSPCAQ